MSFSHNFSVLGVSLPRSQSGKPLKNGATAYIEDGEVKFACAEERFTRQKYDNGFKNSLKACLNEIGNRSLKGIDNIVASTCCDSVWDSENVIERNPVLSETGVKTTSHHLSHAYSAFIPSPFKEALILVIDAGGNILKSVDLQGFENAPWSDYPREQLTIYKGSGTDISLLERDFSTPKEAGFGEIYRAFTHYLGWPSHTYSAHTMALAAYGDPDKFNNLRIFDCESGKLKSRVKNDPINPIGMVERLAENQSVSIPSPRETFGKISVQNLPNQYSHLAACLQRELEVALIEKVRYLVNKTGASKLCIAGGVGLNCVANRKILDNTPIDDIFIQPAAGDTGQALGNALYGYYVETNNSLNQEQDFSPYLGCSYDLSLNNLRDLPAFDSALKEGKIELNGIENASTRSARMIAKGGVVAWFQGRSEYGPRALGNRSILADPRRKDMKAECHGVKKNRQPYRPFSPSVMMKDAEDYFDINRETPYMIMVSNVNEGSMSDIPAVVHVDGTSRLQTVTKDENKKFYRLLQKFKKITGIPMVLNTSFNASGDPIVESPTDALDTFLKLDLDALFIGDVMVKKTVK